jgi:TetR/AcrR family transcriptional repressor of nem operon
VSETRKARRGRDNREALIAQGLELLRDQGYSATGVQEITDAGGVPKGSFYNYFDSKESFALEVLRRYQQEACAEMAALLDDRGLPPLERLSRLFETRSRELAEHGFTGGCLAGRLAQELAGEHPAFRGPLDHTFDCLQSGIAATLSEARERGELAAGADPGELAEFLVNAWQGGMLRAKAAGSDRPLANFRRLVFARLLADETPPAR